ncbi:MAG: 2-haloalkanoic acid dehalogenase, type II [Haloquadratum walsbyi J07HQW2]|uniref:2-haloalkanoic acid dehalogenase, type II n=2 Tax=Haloquadratum walsbyi TaxID=293091 RepID=U1NIR1_9EURY|nr:MAG: 2-haloalkanoic acid dehalogenase, type II [Haloquadratum walsbyi J07HQW2]
MSTEFDPDRIQTVTFDSYSTLVDVEAAEQALKERVENPRPISQLWRSRSLAYTFVANQIDAYQPFYEVNRDALQYALDAHDVALSSSERDEILAVYHELDVFDDVRDSISRLDAAGYSCYVLSNGNPEMLSTMVEHTGIGDSISGTISAAEVSTFKPAAELYQHGAARTGTPIDAIVHATAGWFDVVGAVHAGAQAVWVDRKERPSEPFGPDPHLTVETLTKMCDALGV